MKKSNSYLTLYPICPVCRKEMELDFIDYRSIGSQTEYWICPKHMKVEKIIVKNGKVENW